ncbi:hypothetical protein GCM10010992_07350 [Cloacibacterium rupense]|uniref:PH domain-containing protein n=1 Tax=Cloacibacterium rupense TaxID=517423 RepID=A0ABQ2NG76_9FLAO|nr:hypothetical protein [Cloacibacterium rupense]GGP02544.1 hypothetical protein GCM10010992_07350 [Cloacibacterium rupense]
MTVNYSKKRLFFNLFLGILWLFIGASYLLGEEKLLWHHYGFLIVGLLYLWIFLLEFFKKYFKITSQEIVLFGLKNRKIDFKDLLEIKYFAGDYVFKDKNKSITIVKSQIDKNQLEDFEKIWNEVKSTFEISSQP